MAIRKIIKYVLVEDTAMFFRLYPSKEEQKIIDDIIHFVHVYHNNIIHDIRENFAFCDEEPDKENPGKTLHKFNVKEFRKCMKKPEYYKKYIEDDPRLKNIPADNFNSRKHSVIDNIIKAYGKQNFPVEEWGEPYFATINGRKEKRTKGIKYYTKSNPCLSFYGKIHGSGFCRISDNQNVIMVTIPKVGKMKARGWNKDIRFDMSCEMDFMTYCEIHKEHGFYVTISRDSSNNYQISVMLPHVYVPVSMPEIKEEHIGIDLGEKTLATLSDGTKYKNLDDCNANIKELKKKLRYYDERLSKLQGPANPAWRDELSSVKKQNEAIEKENENLPYDNKKELISLPTLSNNYKRLSIKRAKTYKKLTNIRTTYYHKVSKDIAVSAETLSMETLKIKDMYWPKKKEIEEWQKEHPDKSLPDKFKMVLTKTNDQIESHNRNLQEAALYDFKSMCTYKAERYGTSLQLIDQYERSTGVCPVCGEVINRLDVSVRSWDCPKCGAHHDRDIAAAQVIDQKGYEQYLLNK